MREVILSVLIQEACPDKEGRPAREVVAVCLDQSNCMSWFWFTISLLNFTMVTSWNDPFPFKSFIFSTVLKIDSLFRFHDLSDRYKQFT